MDPRWPWTVAVTAAAIMGLHTEATETAPPTTGVTPPAGQSLRGWNGNGGIVDLLTEGLIHPGEEFVWNRAGRGARHIAHIRSDGALVLTDGRAYTNPSGALTAVGGNHQNGWKTWKRTSDGHTLGDLRARLRTRLGLTGEPRRR